VSSFLAYVEHVTQTSGYSAPLDTKEIQVDWSWGRGGLRLKLPCASTSLDGNKIPRSCLWLLWVRPKGNALLTKGSSLAYSLWDLRVATVA